MKDETTYSNLLSEAWTGGLDPIKLLTHAGNLAAAGQWPLAAILYQTWLKHSTSPLAHVAWFNLGFVLYNGGDLAGAKEAYSKAILASPDFVQPRYNLAKVCEQTGLIEEAITHWHWLSDHVSPDQADMKPLLVSALNSLGGVLEHRKQYYDALHLYSKSLLIEPSQPDVLHNWVFLREKICAWPVYTPDLGVPAELMRRSTSALAMLSLSDDPEAQLESARDFIERKGLANVSPFPPPPRYSHRKIRIGYCSSDFCMHPVSMLLVELFEQHSRTDFEVFGYCWTQQGDSALRRRVIAGMDHFQSIAGMSDEAAAKLIRDQEIDILVDLHGQTLGARPCIFSYRPAPIQITYLGLPATTGLPSIDYVIADRYLIPEESACHYSEKPLYMPDVYQVSDRQRLSAATPSRASCSLPDEGFVFCSFNSNFKCTPEVFDVWMSILRRTPGSVLWLLAANPWAERNLIIEAGKRGIDRGRLVFAPWVLPEQNLGRYPLADLFLDSYPFNAGTTANDALWMGVPVLTRSGRSFASRMAGSLLTAAGLPELITTDWGEYEELAVALAGDSDRCMGFREQLRKVRSEGVLFDTPRFTHHLECHFKRLVAELP